MIKKRAIVLKLFFVCLPVVTGQTINIQPDLPGIHQDIRLRFIPPAKVQLDTLQAILFTGIDEPPDTLQMTLSEGIWQAQVIIQDSAASAFYIVLEGTEQKRTYHFPEKKPFEQLLYSKNGLPVRGAYMTAALMRTGYGHLYEVDYKKANELLEKEVSLYPDNFQARLLNYTFLLKEAGLNRRTAYAISENIQNILSENESAEALKFAVQAYQMIEYQEEAERIERKLEQMMPVREQDATREFNEIMSLEDPEEQTNRLKTFIKTYPENRLNEIALSQLASAVIELDDSTAMINAGEQLLKKATSMAGASGLSALAGVLSEKNWQLDRAEAFIQRAVQIIDKVNPHDHPPELSDAEWQERIRYTTTRYQDIAGWIAFKKGDLDRALALLETAASLTMEPGILWHYAEAQRASDSEDAIVTYARVTAFGGVLGELAMERLETIWNDTGRDPAELDSLIRSGETEVRTAYQKKVLKAQKTRSAPVFVLKRLNGGEISSSEIQGKKVLCFWATWSDASERLIQALYELQDREDITILAVAVDHDPASVSRYVRDYRIPFLVLLNNQQTEYNFELRGVPVLFIIDSENRIQFEHKGFRPDIVDILNIELDHIQ
jgi:tetratricopeptide (TPR) repeat protein